ncbi:MAG: hypothetical protein PHP06_02675 [Clostridia bacterium]|nr:hypothetical protein [Clostridia bacterium]
MGKNQFLSIFIVMIIFIFTGCTSGSYTVAKGNELNTSTKMSMNYEKFNGYKKTKIKVNSNEIVEVSVNIVTESGSIDAYIAKDDDVRNSVYQGSDIPTSSFTVKLAEEGIYTIRVDAKNHSGSYSFSWAK